MSSHSQLTRSTFQFFSGTFLSRLTGLARDMSMAYFFGSEPALASFMIAYRFANLLRRLFGEGSLPSGFIPHFEELRKDEVKKGALFLRDLLFSLAILLSGVVLILEIVLGVFSRYGHLSQEVGEIVPLVRGMLPGILFIGLFGLNSAFLQCEGHFFLIAVAPALFNCVWIGAMGCLSYEDPLSAMRHLSLAISIAYAMQWLATAFKTGAFLRAYLRGKELLRAQLFSLETRRVFRALFLAALGTGAVQINSALDSLFARFASTEGPAYLWYAIRLEQLPLALFGIALSSALLPPLSQALAHARWEQYRNLLTFALKRSYSLIFPCMVALFVLGASGLNLLYGRGDFTEHATVETLFCLWGYALGLVPSVFVLLLAPAFYAQKNYRHPTMASIISVVCNIGLNSLFVFVFDWGAFSVAVATSLAAFLNSLFLTYLLRQKVGAIFSRELLSFFSKVSFSALFSGTATLILGYVLFHDPSIPLLFSQKTYLFSRHLPYQGIHFAVLSGTFGLLFMLGARLFHIEEVGQLFTFLKRLKRTPTRKH